MELTKLGAYDRENAWSSYILVWNLNELFSARMHPNPSSKALYQDINDAISLAVDVKSVQLNSYLLRWNWMMEIYFPYHY